MRARCDHVQVSEALGIQGNCGKDTVIPGPQNMGGAFAAPQGIDRSGTQ